MKKKLKLLIVTLTILSISISYGYYTNNADIKIQNTKSSFKYPLPELLKIYIIENDFETNDSKSYFISQIFTGIGICYEVNNGTLPKEIGKKYVEICINKAISHKSTQFDSVAWEEHPMKYLVSNNPYKKVKHVGYLGYLNLLVAEYRKTFNTGFMLSNYGDDISIFVETANRRKITMFETYPGQQYINDIIVLQYSTLLNFAYMPHNPLYIENLPKLDSSVTSGTEIAVGMYFLKKSNKLTNKEYKNFLNTYSSSIFGYKGIKEDPFNSETYYTPTTGHVISGISTVASGFTVGLSKLFKDECTFNDLYKSYIKISTFIYMTIEEEIVKEAVMYAMFNS